MSYKYKLIRIPPGYSAADEGKVGQVFRNTLEYLGKQQYRIAGLHTGVAFMERLVPDVDEDATKAEEVAEVPEAAPEPPEPDIEDPAAWEDVHDFYSNPRGIEEEEI